MSDQPLANEVEDLCFACDGYFRSGFSVDLENEVPRRSEIIREQIDPEMFSAAMILHFY